jgi:hypothetical protein
VVPGKTSSWKNIILKDGLDYSPILQSLRRALLISPSSTLDRCYFDLDNAWLDLVPRDNLLCFLSLRIHTSTSDRKTTVVSDQNVDSYSVFVCHSKEYHRRTARLEHGSIQCQNEIDVVRLGLGKGYTRKITHTSQTV